jgi:hypothetical protein
MRKRIIRSKLIRKQNNIDVETTMSSVLPSSYRKNVLTKIQNLDIVDSKIVFGLNKMEHPEGMDINEEKYFFSLM